MPRQPPSPQQRRLGDRRQRPRFEIVGQLWGSLELVEPLAVIDLSRGGALVEGAAELPVESVHRLRVETGTETVDVQVRVAHASAVETAQGAGVHRSGVEFLTVPEGAAAWLEAAVAAPVVTPSEASSAPESSESSIRD